MTTHLLNTKICNINNKKLSLKLYNTCISVLQNFGFFFRPPPKLPNFAKFRRNFEPWCGQIQDATATFYVLYKSTKVFLNNAEQKLLFWSPS